MPPHLDQMQHVPIYNAAERHTAEVPRVLLSIRFCLHCHHARRHVRDFQRKVVRAVPRLSGAGASLKSMAGGHILCKEDIRLLQSEGLGKILVAQLDEDEVAENEAVRGVAAETACGSCDIQMAAGGRANLIATEKSCVLVDVDLLRQVNCTSSLVIASTLNFSFAATGNRVACIKSAPFAVSKSDFEGTLNMLRQCGPIMQVRPSRNAAIRRALLRPLQR